MGVCARAWAMFGGEIYPALHASGIYQPDLQEKLDEIKDLIVPEFSEAPGATPKMSDEELLELARKIHDFSNEVNRRYFGGAAG